jgi:hypothetical protein
MKKIDPRYWIELAAIILILVILGWMVFEFAFPGQYPAILPYLLATVVLITVAGQVVLTSLLEQRFSKFNSAFMIYKGLKILILMIFMIAYATGHRDRALPFLGSTFVIYLVFTFFESRALNRESRKQAQR